MDRNMDTEKKWADYTPSEGEHPDRAAEQESTGGVQEQIRSPENRDAAGAAPSQADPKAAESNREFVEDTAKRYGDAEEKFAEGHH